VKSIRSLYRKVIDIGVTDQLSFSDKLRVNLCNLCIAIASALNLLHIILITLNPSSPYEMKISLCWLSLFSTCLILNYFRKYAISNNLIVIGTAIILGAIHYFYGANTRLEPVYLTTLIIGFFIMKPKYRTLIALGIMMIYFANTYIYIKNSTAILESYLVPTAAYKYFAFSIIISGSLISKVILENNSYNQILAIQNKMMTEQNDKMAEKNEELKRFNYIISHDLKEPIRSIVALTGLLKKKIKLEESHGLPNEIISLGSRLNNMIDDIVKFQELDKIKINSETFSLINLVHDIESSLPVDLKNKNHKTYLSGLDRIHTSKTCAYIILKNLIENGIKYNTNVPIIEIHCQKINKEYNIKVSDNGIGIPTKFQDEVFVMFKRLNQKKQEKGTGLGLSISKKLAQKYGAQLDILESSEDSGTTFRLIMPFDQSTE